MSNGLPDNADCSCFKDLIQKRLDGEIDPAENDSLNAHLADCDSCRDELISYLTVQSMVKDTLENPVDVPDGFFESLADELEQKRPVGIFEKILMLPMFTSHRSTSLAVASFVLVAILCLGVANGITDRNKDLSSSQSPMADSHGLIQTNQGDTIVIPADSTDADKYAAALDDLEKAYQEAAGMEQDDQADGYIHTSWRGGESATPIH